VNSSASGGASVLVGETAEDVTTFDVAEWIRSEAHSILATDFVHIEWAALLRPVRHPDPVACHPAPRRHDEATPTRLVPLCDERRKPVAAQHVVHRRGRDRHAELAKFAHDPPVSPAGILPREATDQLNVLVEKRRTP
jgi:hypothetical protein